MATMAICLILGGVYLKSQRMASATSQATLAQVSVRSMAASDDWISGSPAITPVGLSDQLWIRATGQMPSSEEHTRYSRALNANEITLENYVDTLLGNPGTAENAMSVVLPMFVVRGNNTSEATKYILSSFSAPGIHEQVYYLRFKGQCAPEQSELVHPWWDLKDTIRVCTHSHMPEALRDNERHHYCGASAARQPACGCGPNLVYCTRDGDVDRVRESIFREVRDTLAYVAEKDLPLAQAFTMNETVRDEYAEMRYRRPRITAGENPSKVLEGLDKWNSTNTKKLVAREELFRGQEAGIITTSALMFNQSGIRLRVNMLDDILWCVVPKSRNVTTEDVNHLGTADLRTGGGWKALADGPVCNECHARLDYGMQFFSGYPWNQHAVDFIPSEHVKGQGKLYVNGIEDLRGEGELTPRKFVELAVAQPEFSSCMAQRIAGYVMGGAETDTDVRRIRDAFIEKPTYNAALRAGLLIYVEHVRQASGQNDSRAALLEHFQPNLEGGIVHITPKARELIDAHCINCHNEQPRDLSADMIQDSLVSKMLSAVASGDMPKEGHLSDSVRDSLLTELIGASLASPEDRLAAWRYYSGSMRGIGMGSSFVIASILEERAGIRRENRFPIERQFGSSTDDAILLPIGRFNAAPTDFLTQGTPGEALGIDMFAYYKCKEASGTAEKLEDCVSRVSDWHGLVAEPVPEQAPNEIKVGNTK